MQIPRQVARPRDYLLIIAAVVVSIGATLVYYPSLPDPVASHWGFSGAPDGFMPKRLDAMLMPLLVASAGVFVWAAGRADRAAAQLMVGLANGLAVFFAGLRITTFRANTNAATWADAANITAFDLLVPLAVGGLAGIITAYGARYRPEHVVQVRSVSASARASANEQFDGYVTAKTMTVVPAITAAGGFLVYTTVPAPQGVAIAVLLGVITVVAALATRARMQVDAERVTVGFGPFGLPRITWPMAVIDDVVVLDVEPLAYGGWGYRILPGVRAVVLRRGEGIRLSCTGKPDLVITIDEAQSAAAVIARHSQPGEPGRPTSDGVQ